MSTAAAFLDLNGTLVEPVLVTDLAQLRPVPNAAAAVARLCEAGFRCPVVTIQSRIGKGVFSARDFRAWFDVFAAKLRSNGAVLDGPYVCPHRFAEACSCKKPSTLLYERAAQEYDLDLRASYVVGDSAADMEAAVRFGGHGCLVRTGWGAEPEHLARARRHAAFIGADVLDAANWIIGRSGA